MATVGASADKMEKGDWFTGPEWLQHEEKWPEQPTLARSTEATEGEKPLKELVVSASEHKPGEWDQLLEGKPYCTVLRNTAWKIRQVIASEEDDCTLLLNGNKDGLKIELHSICRGAWPEHDRKCRDTHLNRMWLFQYRISVIFFWLTFDIGVPDKESSAKLPFC